MSEKYNGNGGYNLSKLSIIHYSDNDDELEVDISRVIVDVSLYESVFDLTMSGNVSILDTVDLRNIINLYGNERIELEFFTQGAEEYSIVYTGAIYKIDDSVRVSEHAKGYVVHFCSPEFITSNRVHVQQAYKQTNDQIVQKIFSNRLRTSDKRLQASQTQGIGHYVFGSVSPLAAISRTCKDSISTTGQFGFLFYEDNKNFNFKSIHELYQQEPVVEYTFNNAGVYQDVTQRNVEQFTAFQALEVVEDGSFLDRISEGQHGSTWLFYDLKTKETKEVTYDKQSAYDPQNSLGKRPVKRDVSNPNSSDLLVFGVSSAYDVDRLPKSFMAKSGIETVTVKALVFGNSELKCGQTCIATIPNWQSTEEESGLMTSKFLITDIKHNLTKDKFMQVITLTKDAYGEQ